MKHRTLEKADDEQFHVLPLYILDQTDEFGSMEAQMNKVRHGSLEVLSQYKTQVRLRSTPYRPCKKNKKPPENGKPQKKIKLGKSKSLDEKSTNKPLNSNKNRKLDSDSPVKTDNVSPINYKKPQMINEDIDRLSWPELLSKQDNPQYGQLYQNFWDYFYTNGVFPPKTWVSKLSPAQDNFNHNISHMTGFTTGTPTVIHQPSVADHMSMQQQHLDRQQSLVERQHSLDNSSSPVVSSQDVKPVTCKLSPEHPLSVASVPCSVDLSPPDKQTNQHVQSQCPPSSFVSSCLTPPVSSPLTSSKSGGLLSELMCQKSIIPQNSFSHLKNTVNTPIKQENLSHNYVDNNWQNENTVVNSTLSAAATYCPSSSQYTKTEQVSAQNFHSFHSQQMPYNYEATYQNTQRSVKECNANQCSITKSEPNVPLQNSQIDSYKSELPLDPSQNFITPNHCDKNISYSKNATNYQKIENSYSSTSHAPSLQYPKYINDNSIPDTSKDSTRVSLQPDQKTPIKSNEKKIKIIKTLDKCSTTSVVNSCEQMNGNHETSLTKEYKHCDGVAHSMIGYYELFRLIFLNSTNIVMIGKTNIRLFITRIVYSIFNLKWYKIFGIVDNCDHYQH